MPNSSARHPHRQQVGMAINSQANSQHMDSPSSQLMAVRIPKARGSNLAMDSLSTARKAVTNLQHRGILHKAHQTWLNEECRV